MNTSRIIMLACIALTFSSAIGADVNVKDAEKHYRQDAFDRRVVFSRLCAKNTNIVAELAAAQRSGLTNDTSLAGELTSFRLSADDEAAIAKLLGEIPSIDPQLLSLSIDVDDYAVMVKAAARIGNGYYYAYLFRANGAKWRLLEHHRFWPEPKRQP